MTIPLTDCESVGKATWIEHIRRQEAYLVQRNLVLLLHISYHTNREKANEDLQISNLTEV